jgi:hypothetical protein
MTRIDPPSGVNPPEAFELPDGTRIELAPLARDLCDHYYDVYPDDIERYGAAGRAWCDHDSRYLLAWALEDARAGAVDCVEQVRWLGHVLAARSFPVEQLARHVELVAAVLDGAGLGDIGTRAGERMREAANALAPSSSLPDRSAG